MALLSQPPIIKQYAADDIGFEATKQRDFWKDRQKQAFAAQQAQLAQQNQPKDVPGTKAEDYSVITKAKDEALDKEYKGLLDRYKKKEDENELLFQKFFNEAKAASDRGAADAARIRELADNTKYKEDLAKARADQEAAMAESQRGALDYVRGNLESRLLGDPLKGLSSNLLRAATQEYARAQLPYNERLAQGRLADTQSGWDYTMRTASLPQEADRSYLSTLLTPLRERTAMMNANISTLGALGDASRANRFTGLVSNYDTSAMPSLPGSMSTFRVPPPTGYYPMRPSYTPPQASFMPPPETASGYGRRPQQTSGRSEAEIAYRNDTGYWPQEDPNFNAMLYESYGGRIGSGQTVRDARQQQVEEAMVRAADARERWGI